MADPTRMGLYLGALVVVEQRMEEQVADNIQVEVSRSWKEYLEARMEFGLPHKD